MSKKIVDIKSEFENAAREEWQTLFEEYASDERSGVKNLILSYQKKQIAYEKELLRLETMLAFEKKYGNLYKDEIEKLQGYKEKLLELDNGTNGIKNIYNKMSNMYDFFFEEY